MHLRMKRSRVLRVYTQVMSFDGETEMKETLMGTSG